MSPMRESESAAHGSDESVTDIDGYGIGDTADLLGVTVRTLRHWDQIGLLSPQWRTVGGHRLYTAEDIGRAHRILVYREAGVGLDEVRQLLDGKSDERSQLMRQRKVLEEKASHLRQMIGAVDELLEAIDMNKPMSPQDAAKLFGEEWRQDWQDEAEQRWGNTDAWAESQERQKNFTQEDWAEMYEQQELIVQKLAEAARAGAHPDSEIGREISAMHRKSVGKHYECGHGRQVILARMYLADDRFRPAYEKGGEPGAVEFLVAAVEADARANGVDPDAAQWD